jgi:hypothetical protein
VGYTDALSVAQVCSDRRRMSLRRIVTRSSPAVAIACRRRHRKSPVQGDGQTMPVTRPGEALDDASKTSEE